MEEALRSLLLSSAPIAAIVSRRADWGLRPQGDPYPGITLNAIGGGPIMNLAGPSGWARNRIQIDCWAQTFKQARDLGDLIAGRSGGPGLLVGMRRDVAGIRMRSIIAARRGGTDRDEKPVHRDSIDVMLWHAAL